MQTRKVALVLGSGGAKGYAHIGAIKALEEAGVQITSIAGTSMGAFVGGLYAAGKLDEAYKQIKGMGNWDLLRLADIKNISKKGMIDGQHIFRMLEDILGDIRIEELPIPYCAIAADLDVGEEKVFTTGRLVDAIRASISLPMFFAPHVVNKRRYVDGGILNGLPINHVARQKDDIVVAIDLDTYAIAKEHSMAKELSETWFTPQDLEGYFHKLVPVKLPGKKVQDVVAGALSKLAMKLWKIFLGENMFSILLDTYFIALKHNRRRMVETEKPEIYINIDLKGYTARHFSDAVPIAQLGYDQVTSELKSERCREILAVPTRMQRYRGAIKRLKLRFKRKKE